MLLAFGNHRFMLRIQTWGPPLVRVVVDESLSHGFPVSETKVCQANGGRVLVTLGT